MSKVIGSCLRGTVVAVGIGLLLSARANAQCVGDCAGDGAVGPGDLNRIIAIILNCGSVAAGCPAVPGIGCSAADRDKNTIIGPGELNFIISNILNFPATNGCPPSSPTPTHTQGVAPSNTPTRTNTQAATPTHTPTATASPTATQAAGFCGDGVPQTGEDCDDGGYCVGGPTKCFGGSKDGQTCDPTIPLTCGLRLAGRPDAEPDPECRGIKCTSDAECGDGACVAAGGDGCAVNCTPETSRAFVFTGAECDTGANIGKPCLTFSATADCGPAPKCRAVGECEGGAPGTG